MPEPTVPSARALIERIRALPAAAPLIPRLAGADGIYLVGGAVRDILRGFEPADLDLVVEGDAGELAARLGDGPRRHGRFGTAAITLEGRTYDIASARRESYARPGALPEVAPASLGEDLERRDFTVNAMAIALGGPSAGELRAVPEALEDLAARRLRVLHPRSFNDDPTRLFRLARYSSRLGFEVEPATLKLVESALEAGALETVSGSRIGAELRLLAREPDPVGAFEALRVLGVDRAVAEGFGLRDPKLANDALALLPDDGRADLVTLAVAAVGVPADELSQLLDRLAFENRDRDTIVLAASRGEELATMLQADPSRAWIGRALAGSSPEQVAVAGAYGAKDQAIAWIEHLRHVKLEIDGGDLLAAGISEGPALGRGLQAALAAKLDGRVSGREQELAEALRAARGSG